MFRILKNGLLSFVFTFISIKKCTSDLLPPAPPSLIVYSPGSVEYSEVLVRRVHDNLTLVCELRGDGTPRRYLWNYLADEQQDVHQPLQGSPAGPTTSSTLVKTDLQVSDSGQYICSAPPYSQTKYILVQTRGPKQCAKGAFWCGKRCVLPSYVCDGHRDCLGGEDEAPRLCQTEQPCRGADKLNCSSGRCVPAAACCRPGASPVACRQPYCCDEHRTYSRDGFVDVEYPALFEDRHASDDYGFIQSTIYTVTACALIFMIAVVLLVSAICKMHMKRAALRTLAQRRPAHRHLQTHMYGSPRFPPCYEASRLLEESRANPNVLIQDAPESPLRSPVTPPGVDCPETEGTDNEQTEEPSPSGFARLGAIFSSRYRQVPTNSEVEMTSVRCNSLNNSPTRQNINNYRSPTFCDLNNADFYFASPESESCGRDLNYMATPIEFFRRRTLNRNNPIDRILDQIERPRPLTLQLGRFQLSIPRFGRGSTTDLGRRPDTPNVAEINIDDLDFVRLNSNETYTLNGRTIRLLGANFENYPTVLSNNSVVGPPPYNEAMRYKVYGPPPEYLSRDTLLDQRDNNETSNVDEQARSNIEMPPRYEDLASGVNADSNGNSAAENNDVATAVSNDINNGNAQTLSAIMDNLPPIDGDVNANETVTGINNDIVINNDCVIVDNGNE